MAAERLTVFPAFHKVDGRRVLVVGDGAEAVAKVRLLGETSAHVRLVATLPSAELAELISCAGLEHLARPFEANDLDDVVLVFAANADRDRDAEIVAAARARGIPANAVDLPDLCDFYTPAIVNRAPVAIAITSTGAGPVLAQKLRARIEAMLPMQLGLLATLGESFRGAAEQMLPKGQPRRRFWSAFFGGAVADTALAGRIEEARRLAFRLLSGAETTDKGFVWLVGAGPGDPDLLTLRAHRILQEADVIVHDAIVPASVVSMGRRDAERISVGRQGHGPAQGDIEALLVAQAEAGKRVVRLKGGDAATAAEVAALSAAGILFEIVPGLPCPVSVAGHATEPSATASELAA